MRVETPTPYAVGTVNAYLVDVPPVTLVDSGIDTPEARAALQEALGDSLSRIERVAVTHGHADHYGLAGFVAERSGAEVLFPEAEMARFSDPGMLEAWGRLLLAQGVPLELLLELDRVRRSTPGVRPPRGNPRPLRPGDRLEFEGLALDVLPSPGHTGGHLVFFEPHTRTLFAGDQLLPEVSPNPLLEPPVDGGTRRRALVDYLGSLEELAALAPRLVYPGHGPPVTDPQALIERTVAHHERRARRIRSHLGTEPLTPYALARKLYPRARGYDIVLAVSEVVAHLDLLVDREEAEVLEEDGIVVYRAAPPGREGVW